MVIVLAYVLLNPAADTCLYIKYKVKSTCIYIEFKVKGPKITPIEVKINASRLSYTPIKYFAAHYKAGESFLYEPGRGKVKSLKIILLYGIV